MQSITLVDGTDLTYWANRRDAQAQLPQLLRKLVHATVEQVLSIGFPAGEGIQLGGWDGIVVVEQGNAFVPDGASAWEMGTTKNIKGKADDDYAKRLRDPRGIEPSQSTHVFVTPRRWGGKGDWVSARQADGVWREVRAYDADDIEQWLELALPVHIWLSILLGKRPENAIDIVTFWADWSETTQPPTSIEFVLSGRCTVVSKIHDWLRSSSTSLALQGESREEAIAVFAAALDQLQPTERGACHSRAIIARDITAWHRAISSDKPLILVPLFDSRDVVSRATRAGHKVLIPLGRADSTSIDTIGIPRLSRREAVEALVASGIAEEQARDLATLARRSLTAFRRKRALNPEVQQPEWARPAEGRCLLPAMLAGAWGDATERDRQVVAELAQSTYEEVSQTLMRWSNESDPPVRHIGNAWYVASKEDSWLLLARYLTKADLERFEKVVLDVLGTYDLRFDLPSEERWMAGVLVQAPQHSGLLREGLAETLAIMGARGDSAPLVFGVSTRNYAARIVKGLLERANADWRVWASLSQSLSLLVEAAPDVFLAAIEEDLVGEQPVLLNLFNEQGDPLFSSSPHTGLLWALETLAWNAEHLGHTALVLAKLARLDPGGRLINRPQNSLHDIFRLWLPQTSATLDQRLRVLDVMREREPEVAWQLMGHLLPEHFETGRYTSTPQWRDWAPDSSKRATPSERIKGIREVVTRMLADAGKGGRRWQRLIESLPTLPVDQHEAVVARLEDIDLGDIQPSDSAAIWNALRTIISQHRSFADEDWALPKELVDRLCEIFTRFEPQSLIDRYAWLFSHRPELLEGREKEWKLHEEMVATKRLDAVQTIYAEAGLPGMFELIGHVEKPGEVGETLGRSNLAVAQEDELLLENFAPDDTKKAIFARGFAIGCLRSKGWEWAETKLIGSVKGWPSMQQAVFLFCLPSDSRTWGFAESFGPETEQLYWRIFLHYGINASDVEYATRKLIEYGRPYTAVDLLSFHTSEDQSLPINLIVDALENTLQTLPQDDPPDHSFSFDLSRLLNLISRSDEVSESRIAAIEWAYLPLLDRAGRPPKLLHSELSRNPDFFAEMIELVFRGEEQEPRDLSEDEQARARHAYRLLQSWRTVPGKRDAGDIDNDALKMWIQKARHAVSASGRGIIGDQMIGQVLSGSSYGDDGIWPHPAVRDVIEEVASAELERGAEIGVYNSRGVFAKLPTEGGAQERELAEKYAEYAVAVCDRWPRTAAMLRRIAEGYRADARREDEEAELREDLGK